ncbi:MAG TPA: hypothetical protein VFJ14_05060 [Nocardioidaceae bacterium]|nr:hypothetical protein [Nocardioidaceae bacterium]
MTAKGRGTGRLRGTADVDPAERVRDFARVQARAGLLADHAVVVEVSEAAAEDLGADEAAVFAHRVLAEVRAELLEEQAGWPDVTDHDRLEQVFAALEHRDLVVLQGVDDHWAATRELERLDDAGQRTRGIAWFTAPDVWHAIDHGMLEVNLWHGDTANAAPGDELLDEVVAVFADHGLAAHFDEGRIEVAAFWQRRLAEA